MNADKSANYAKVKAQELQNNILPPRKIRSEGFIRCTASYTEKMCSGKPGDESKETEEAVESMA